MAQTDKNIVITPNIGQTADPKIAYSGANASVGAQTITLYVYPDNSGTLSWEGSAGQLMSVTNTLTGTIFAVNDVSGIPSITVQDTGQVTLAPYTGNLVIGNVTDANTAKVQITGTVSATGNITAPFFIGNGSALTGITASGGSSIINGTSNVVVAASGNVTVGVAGTAAVTTFATTGIFVPGLASVTGNVQGGNLRTAGLISATGNVDGGNITASGSLGVGTTASASYKLDVAGKGRFLQDAAATTGAIILRASTSNTTSPHLQFVSTDNSAQYGYITINAAGVLSTTSSMVTSGSITGASLVGTITTAAQTNITSVGTLSSLSVTGNVQGGNLRTAGLISATGAINGAALTGTSLTVSTGNITGGNIVNANANGVGNIGTTGGFFNTVFAKATSAQYADVAEKYRADAQYVPGTVLEIGGSAEVTATTDYASTRIAGVVSTNPAFIMNSSETSENSVELALLGRIPCRVVGKIERGDMLCSSRIAGVATALNENLYKPGAVIGKALESYNSVSDGVIEILVGRL